MARFDLVIFGASGFTGQFVTQYLAKIVSEDLTLKNLTFAVAGRSEKKLDEVLNEISNILEDKKWLKTAKIIADVNNEKDMNDMAKAAKVVLNCVGPYRFFGEQVVKACVENSTDYVDITGEPQFIEEMEAKYNDLAEKNGSIIVSTCGFDSIPADLGVAHAVSSFKGKVSSVESFLECKFPNNIRANSGHFATWESAVYGVANANKLRKFRSTLPRVEIPFLGSKLKPRSTLSSVLPSPIEGHPVPFPGSDASVVRRSQISLIKQASAIKPVQYAAYFTVKSKFWLFCVMLVGQVLTLLANYKWGRYLLLKYPGLFTLGVFGHVGPSKKQRDGTFFTMTFIAKGWKEGSETSGKCDMQQISRVKGPEPGYVATPIIMVSSAIVLLRQRANIPFKGGVFTPATVFRSTTLISDLKRQGISFDTLSTSDK